VSPFTPGLGQSKHLFDLASSTSSPVGAPGTATYFINRFTPEEEVPLVLCLIIEYFMMPSVLLRYKGFYSVSHAS